jgi:hypothetical protein
MFPLAPVSKRFGSPKGPAAKPETMQKEKEIRTQSVKAKDENDPE